MDGVVFRWPYRSEAAVDGPCVDAFWDTLHPDGVGVEVAALVVVLYYGLLRIRRNGAGAEYYEH